MDREILPNIKDTSPLRRYPPMKSHFESHRAVHTSTESTPRSETILIALSYLVVLILFPVAVFCCITTVKEYERVVILRLGRLRKRGMFGPGVLFLLPCVDEYYKVDMRTKAFDVEPQEILTKDSVTISVDAVVYYSIRNPLDSVLQVADVTESTRLLAQTTLRNVIGTKNLMEMLTAKETLSKTIEKILDDATDAWGVKVERVEILPSLKVLLVSYLEFYAGLDLIKRPYSKQLNIKIH
ncbi:stomatin-like isoform 3-T4 [Glossina fuscipes fuscipes]